MYRVVYLESVVKHDIPALTKTIKSSIKTAIESRPMLDPIKFGKPLQFSLKGHRRLRVGDYRVVYRIDSENKLVIVVAIKHRKEIYR